MTAEFYGWLALWAAVFTYGMWLAGQGNEAAVFAALLQLAPAIYAGQEFDRIRS